VNGKARERTGARANANGANAPEPAPIIPPAAARPKQGPAADMAKRARSRPARKRPAT
jgi:hypothetical protein